MKRIVYFMIVAVLYVCQSRADDDLQVTSIQYWIDNDHTAATVGSSLEFDIDCSALPTGLHTLHYRVADNKGNFSSPKEHSFFKLPSVAAKSKIETLQYWWDDMTQNPITMPYSSEEFIISADFLPIGLHSLKYRVKDDAGVWSDLRSHYFYRGEALDSARIVSYSYWWNDLTDKTVVSKLESPVSTLSIDEEVTVPEYARTGYAGHYTATFHLVVTDNHGKAVYLTQDVAYPDNDAPSTDIDADSYVASSSVTINWIEKSGDKMGDYNVYFSKDNGPFILWLPDTKLTSATFKGERGSMYLFTVTGRDAFGNREKFDETKCVSVTFE